MKIETTLSRRRLLASVPAVAAAVVPTLATALGGLAAGSDPVFAAIETHRTTIRAFEAAFEPRAHLEDTLPAAQRSWQRTAWEPDPPEGCTDAPEWIAVELEIKNANERDCDAEAMFLTTRPTTLAGILASLEHAAEDAGGDGTILDSASRCCREDVSDAAEAYPAMIAATLRKLLAGRATS
jgi:hypothetical protein